MRDLVERLWREAHPEPEAIARYLRGRGLSAATIPTTLRWHAKLEYFDELGRAIGAHPAIVARVESLAGELVGLHRTYLDSSGTQKADVLAPKKLLAVRDRATTGAVIRLAEAGQVLGVTEGIETGLAVMEATGIPVWAAISAGGMEDVELPPTVQRLELWADHDANGRGQRAAEIRAAQAVAAGLEVAIVLPREPGDWLDVLRAQGAAALVDAQWGAPPWRPPTASSPSAAAPHPAIDAGDEDLPRVAAAAWSALLEANTPAVIFRHGGWPAWIEHDDDGVPVIRPLTPDRLRHRLARVADWYRIRRDERRPAMPPESVVRDLLARPDPPLPILARVVEAPVFAADGTLQTAPGYHAAGQTYYEPAAGLVVPAIPSHPSAADVAASRRWLLQELLGDFPFTGDAELAHALALLLLPFARALIDGSTPFHLIEKPAPGTGASLLASVLVYPSLGRSAPALTEGRDEDEWRKRIAAMLRGGRPVVLLDNLRRRLESAALCSAITAPVWEDRVLGATEMGRWPVTCAWIGTGNNPSLSDELARRTVRIRLDAREDRPWLRTGFRHPDLLAWAAGHRGALVHAALVLIRAWLHEGRPAGGGILGMFESWSRVMGGILAVAGVPGFLGNLDALYQESDEEGSQVRGFLAGWWAKHQDRDVTVSEVYDLAVMPDSPLDLDAKTEHGRRIKLGKVLGRLRDRRYRLDDGRTICISRGVKVHQALVWRLHDVGRNSPHSPTLPGGESRGEYGSVGEYPPPLLSSRAGARAQEERSETLPETPTLPGIGHTEGCDCRECAP
jgi:hypothetical protein